MAYTLVQSKAGKGNSGTSVSVSGLTATTAGNLLVMIVDGEKNPGDVTFTPPANWVQIGATQHQDVFIAISGTAYYYPNNPGGITSVAVTASSALSAWHCYFLEFSGVTTSSPLDAQSVRTQMATTAPSSGNITTTQAGDLVIGWISEDDVNGAYTLTQPGGWTALTRNQDAGAWVSLYVAYKTAGSAGTESYAPTLSSTATDSVVGVAAFLAAGGGGTTVNGIGESDGAGSATASATLATAGQSVGTGQASAQATLAVAAAGIGQGQAQAITRLATAAQSIGQGQATASATLATAASSGGAGQSDALLTGPVANGQGISAGNGSADALAALALAATSDGHAITSAATPIVQPAGAVSSGAGLATLTLAAALTQGAATLSDASVASATLGDALVSRASLGDTATAALVLADS